MDMMRHHRVPTLQYALSSAIKGEAMVLPEQKATLPGTGAAEGRDAPLPVTDL